MSVGAAYPASIFTSLLLTALTIWWHFFGPTTTTYDPSNYDLAADNPHIHRKVWHDTMDLTRDIELPETLRGDHNERIHYMDTITPADEREWFSVCVVDAELQQELDEQDEQRFVSTSSSHQTPAAAVRAARRAVETESVKQAGQAASAQATARKQGKTNAYGKVEGLKFKRDQTHKHHYTNSSPSSSSKSQTRFMRPSEPLGFQHLPKRNPKLACIYSPTYRAEHAELCLDIVSKHNKQPSHVETLQAPFKTDVSFTIKSGKDVTCASFGWFSNDLLTSGWNYLYVETNPTLSDALQARAAGYLEGALTTQPIYEHHQNEFQVLFPNNGTIANSTKSFLTDMTTFNLQMVASQGATDPYFYQLGLLYQQLQGVYEGYSAANMDPNKVISYFDLLCLQYDGDMSDIQSTVGAADQVDASKDNLQTIMTYLILHGHCSALVKVTDNNQELFAAHDTWAGFSSTHRMFKAYRLPFTNVSSTAVHFSSYPAFLASTDDWYQTLETQLTILETTNDIINQTLYQYVDSSSVATWARAVIAYRLATGGNDWTGYFGYWQSGTYNNQWMVVDYSLFVSGQPIVANTLWISETMPGSVYSADVSSILRDQNYWASYNRPYFTPIYTNMGYALLNQTYGPYLFGYHEYFRAEIFAREQPNIEILFDMQRVMSLNRWQTDPWSHNNSGFAISSRFDLSTYDPVPSLGFFYRGAWGAYDVKITNSQWMANLNGPDPKNNSLRVSTHSGPTSWDQPVFTWSDPEWTNYSSHIGLPNTYDFEFLQFHLHHAAD